MEVLRYNTPTTNFIHQQVPLVSQAMNASPRKENARRRLNFGAPVQAQTCAQEANEAFVQRLMSQMASEYSQKWEFDFEAGQPLPSSSTSRFHYKQVETNSLPSVYSPIVHSSPVSSDLENLSDSENCVLNANRLANVTNSEMKSESEQSSFNESTEFVLPCQSPKKMLKKPSPSAYSTPKKTRVTHLTDYMSYRKRKSITLVASKKSSPFKSVKARHSERLSSHVLRRHSMAN